LAQLFAHDCILVASNGKSYKGGGTASGVYSKARREIAESFETFTARYDIESVRVAGDQAVVFGPIEVSGRTTGGQDFRKRVCETLVLRRSARSWKIIHEHSSIAPEDQR
jgi:ketosteroid isomerase-like protein